MPECQAISLRGSSLDHPTLRPRLPVAQETVEEAPVEVLTKNQPG